MLRAALKAGMSAAAGRSRHAPPYGARTGTRSGAGVPAAALLALPLALAGCVVSDTGLTPPLPVPDAAGRPSATATDASPGAGPGTQLFAGTAAPANSDTGRLPSPQPVRQPAGMEPVQRSTLAAPEPATADEPQIAETAGRAQAFPASTTNARSAQVAVRRAPAAQARSTATVRFTPVIGAPIDAIRPLSKALETTAREKGITIQTSADSPPDNILRGYFSASKSGGRTEIVYVWDVLDAEGNQLYRIQNTRKVQTRGDGKTAWSGVPDSTMQSIARRTIDDYLAWRASTPG